MAEISIHGLYKSFGEHTVLKDLNLELFPGERAAIVGPNGAGKTTLLKILCSKEDYDSGEVYINRQSRVGLLEQLPEYPADRTVRQILWEAFAHLEKMSAEMRQLEAAMAAGEDCDLDRYSRLQLSFETQGGYEAEYRYNMMTNGLDIPPDMQDRPFMSLSGGEKTRVNLARIMLSGADILLLDEPTNHLDMGSIEWLEDYLRSFKGTVLIISHDRWFLDRVTNRTLELEEGRLVNYPGNYSWFVDRKAELQEQAAKARARQEKELQRLQKAADRLHLWAFMGNDHLHNRAFAIEKRMQRMELIKTVRQQHKLKGRFTVADRSGDAVFVRENIADGHDGPLVRDLNTTVYRGERVALLGPNGAGKTTLLTTLLGQKEPLAGRIHNGVGLKIGYLPQVVSFDHPERNLVDTLLWDGNCDTPQEARDRLAAFSFRGEEVFKTVGVLSGGEKTRLRLCQFMGTGVNTLFLDEPTNHLDILSREWVEDAIDEFSETVIFVSHDRYFINRFATRIWQIMPDGTIRDYIGTYEEFRAMLQREQAQAASLAAPKERKPENSKKAASPNKKSGKAAAKAVENLETRLAQIEREMAENPQDYQLLQQLCEEKDQLEEQLLELYEQLDSPV